MKTVHKGKGFIIKPFIFAVVAYFFCNIARNFFCFFIKALNVNVLLYKTYFAANKYKIGCSKSFAGNMCIGIKGKTVVKNSIRNLVTQFVRVTFAYRFRSK